jgi:hypothetical protein
VSTPGENSEGISATVKRASGRRWGTVLGVVTLAAGAVLFAPRMFDDVTANAAPHAADVVTCSMTPVLTVDPGVTGKSADFAGTLLPGTAVCLDTSGDAKKIIGASYEGVTGVSGTGSCAAFTLKEADVPVTWFLADGTTEEGTITIPKTELSSTGFTAESKVNGGQLEGAGIEIDVSDFGSIPDLAAVDCASDKGATQVAAGFTLKITRAAKVA